MSDENPIEEPTIIDIINQRDEWAIERTDNSGWIIRFYDKRTYMAAFTTFDEMVKWMADQVGEDLT